MIQHTDPIARILLTALQRVRELARLPVVQASLGSKENHFMDRIPPDDQ